MTTSLTGWFETEAAACLDRIEALLDDVTATVSQERVQREVRTLGGVARLADIDRVHAAAASIARTLRNPISPVELRRLLSESVVDLRALVAGETDDAELEKRLDTIRASWAEDATTQEVQGSDDGAFLDWVAHEAAEIAEAMDRGVLAFVETPDDREPLAMILRRQRALLGAARLPSVPVVGETLHAVEDLTNLIVRLKVPVKTEWLDVFRCARDVLRSSASALQGGSFPEPVNALSRLRTLRDELVDRYGPRIPEPESPRSVKWPEGEPAAAATSTEGEAVPAFTPTAMERAIALRPAIEAGMAPSARTALDELYTLLRQVLA